MSPTPRKPVCSIATMTSRTSRKLSFASPRITILGFVSAPTAARRVSSKCSAATGWSLIHSPPASSMETRMRPLSSPCAFGFVVFGRLTSGPFRICGAITMKMISRTSTTSTSGVMLMVACILPGSPSRIGRPSLFDRGRLHFSRFDAKHRDLRYSGHGVPECARDELERSNRIASALAHAVVLDDARRDHLRHVGILVQPPGFDQILDVSPMKELLELGLELFRLARGRAEAAVLVYDHPHRKNGKQGEANHHRASE